MLGGQKILTELYSRYSERKILAADNAESNLLSDPFNVFTGIGIHANPVALFDK